MFALEPPLLPFYYSHASNYILFLMQNTTELLKQVKNLQEADTFHRNTIDDQEQMELEKAMQLLEEWKIQSFLIYADNFNTILSKIQHISFIQLKQINISASVCSLEPVSRIYMPAVQMIYFPCNKMIKIKTIIKGYWPLLQQLALGFQHLHDVATLCLLPSFSKKVAFQLVIGQCEDSSWIAKIQHRCLKQICLCYLKKNTQITTKQHRVRARQRQFDQDNIIAQHYF